MNYSHPMNAIRQENDISLALKEQRSRIAAFFRERRNDAGISIEAAARAMDLENFALVAFENATEPMPLELIFALTNFLNIPPEDTLNLIYDVHNAQGRSK